MAQRDEDQPVTISWPGRRINPPAAESLVPVLSGPEALIVAELLEQIADDPASDQNAIAQLLIMRIHDRLEIIEDPAGATEPQQSGKLISLFPETVIRTHRRDTSGDC